MKKLPLLISFSVLILLSTSACVQGQNEYSFMTFNIWQEGTSVDNGLEKIRDVIIETNADVICFSEVRNYENEDWTRKIVDELKASGHKFFQGFAGGDVSIISKFPILDAALIYEGEGSIAQFDIKVHEQKLKVACAHLDYTFYASYLPRGYNGGDPDWGMIDNGNGDPQAVTDTSRIFKYNLRSERDEQIEAFVDSMDGEKDPVILMGDFNEPSHLDWTLETKAMFNHNNVVMEWPSTKLLEDFGFVDAYRAFFPDENKNPGITWPSLAHGVKATTWTPLADERDRIDFIFYKGAGISTSYASLVGPKESYVLNKLDTTFTSNDNFIATKLEWPSDHKAVLVKLEFIE